MSVFDESSTEPSFVADEFEQARRRAAARFARSPAIMEPSRVTGTLPELATLERIAAAAGLERRSLPCFASAEAGDLNAAADACDAVAGRETCRWQDDPSGWCAHQRTRAELEAAVEHLRRADVPLLFADRVVAAARARGRGDAALQATEALRLVRAFLAERPQGVILDDGNTVSFVGDEWCLALAGAPGNGKTLAAAYAIARAGGAWVAARELGNPRFGLREVERAPMLVVDDVGTEYAGESGYAIGRVGELLESRHADKRRTILTTNLMRRRRPRDLGAPPIEEPPQFAERYGDRVDDRLRERAKFVVLAGPSLRGRV